MINVLIIEDEAFIARDIFEIISELTDFNAFIAPDFFSAIKIANMRQIHIVIADINIKGLHDGIETATLLVALHGCQVIFLTSFIDDDTLKRASEIRFFAYLVKPFKTEELITNVRLCAMKTPSKSSFVNITDEYIFDKMTQTLFYKNEIVMLSLKERLLFLTLCNSIGKMVPLAYIDEVVWQGEAVSENTRRQLLHRLKQKTPNINYKIIKSYGYTMEIICAK